ncbi:MAG TPA: hypothetical protein VLM37_10320, partial [Fibrobacteraceae bacterium]|nr:hypothetical protein [Fibrobacteraceae bacterium]
MSYIEEAFAVCLRDWKGKKQAQEKKEEGKDTKTEEALPEKARQVQDTAIGKEKTGKVKEENLKVRLDRDIGTEDSSDCDDFCIDDDPFAALPPLSLEDLQQEREEMCEEWQDSAVADLYDPRQILQERRQWLASLCMYNGTPFDWLSHYKPVEHRLVYVSQGLATTIGQAWTSREWSDHPWITSRKSKSNLAQFVELVAYAWLRSNETSILYYSMLNDIFNHADDQINYFFDLLGRQWQSPNGKHICQLAKIQRDGCQLGHKPLQITWNPHPFGYRRVEMELRRPIITKYLNKRRKADFVAMGSSRILSGEYFRWLELTKPTWDQCLEQIDWQAIAKEKNEEITDAQQKGKRKKKKKKLRTVEGIQHDYRMKYDWLMGSPCFFAASMDRHYAPSIQLPCAIRNLLRWHGKRLAWIDVSSMHPTIIFRRFADMCASDREKQTIESIIQSEN